MPLRPVPGVAMPPREGWAGLRPPRGRELGLPNAWELGWWHWPGDTSVVSLGGLINLLMLGGRAAGDSRVPRLCLLALAVLIPALCSALVMGGLIFAVCSTPRGVPGWFLANCLGTEPLAVVGTLLWGTWVPSSPRRSHGCRSWAEGWAPLGCSGPGCLDGRFGEQG